MSNEREDNLQNQYTDAGLTYSETNLDVDTDKEKEELKDIETLGLTVNPSFSFTRIPRDMLISVNNQFIATARKDDAAAGVNTLGENTYESRAGLLKEVLERSQVPLHSRILNANISYSLEGSSLGFGVVLSDSEYYYFLRTHRLPIFVMSEVQLWRTSRFLYEIKPQENPEAVDTSVIYFKRFWGLITNVSSSGSQGSRQLNITCDSLLKFMTLSPTPTGGKMEALITYLGTTQGESDYLNLSNYTLAPYECFNKNILGTILWAFSRAYRYFSIPQGISFGTEDAVAKQIAVEWQEIHQEVMGYWQKRMESIGQAVRVFGLQSVEWVDENNPSKTLVNDATATQNTGDPEITKVPNVSLDYGILDFFYPNWGKISAGSFLQSDQMDLYTFVKELCEQIGFEFFSDVDGSIVIKPPLYNVITGLPEGRGNSLYTLTSQDIIDVSTTESEANIKTALEVRGNWFPGQSGADQFQPYGFFIDRNLASMFGLRYHQVTVPYLKTDAECRLFARMTLSEINQAAFSLSVSIVDRPELHIGLPVYIAPLDVYGYIIGIDAPITVGSITETTLTLTAIRYRVYNEEGKVMRRAGLRRTRDSVDEASDVADAAASDSGLEEKNIDRVDIKGGVYELEVETDSTADDLVETAEHIYATEDYIPITDKYGYRVIGALPYGRAMKLDEAHNLVWGEAFNQTFSLPDGSEGHLDVKKGKVISSSKVIFEEGGAKGDSSEERFYTEDPKTAAQIIAGMEVPEDE